MGETEEVELRFIGLDRGVFCDDAGAGAGGVEEDAVEAGDDFGEGPGVVGGDDGVFGAEAVDVADEGFGAGFVAVVGEEDAWGGFFSVSRDGRFGDEGR